MKKPNKGVEKKIKAWAIVIRDDGTFLGATAGDVKKAQKVIDTLIKIAKKTGYKFEFENCDISMPDKKTIKIVGNLPLQTKKKKS